MKALLIVFFSVLAGAVAMAQAAAVAAQPTGTPVNVLVAPFSESGSLIRPGWLSSRFTNAIQDNLDQIKQVAIVAPATTAPIDASTSIGQILDRAREADAEVAVIGVIHTAADKLSVSGNIYDVSSGSSFGNFKASGTTQDLFAIQDSVIRQIHMMVARLAQPPAEPSQTLASAGSTYEGSDLQASVNSYDFRGLHLSNAASTNYQDQPYHVVEQPNINFLLPYYGGYGYNNYGWPSYTYYPWSSPYYSAPSYLGWGYWPRSSPTVVIINQRNGSRSRSRSYHGGGHAMSQRANQVPPEIATRNQNISHVATPPPNTIQHSPSYEIRYGSNTIQQSPSYEIRPVQR